jgi:hypothetical protein
LGESENKFKRILIFALVDVSNFYFFSQDSDSVTNRVAGFVCKYVFAEHMSCVTSMVVIGKEQGMDTTYLVSSVLFTVLHAIPILLKAVISEGENFTAFIVHPIMIV